MFPTKAHGSRFIKCGQFGWAGGVETSRLFWEIVAEIASKHLMEKIEPDLIRRPQEVSLDKG